VLDVSHHQNGAGAGRDQEHDQGEPGSESEVQDAFTQHSPRGKCRDLR